MKEPHMRIVIAIFFANLRDPAKHHKIQIRISTGNFGTKLAINSCFPLYFLMIKTHQSWSFVVELANFF